MYSEANLKRHFKIINFSTGSYLCTRSIDFKHRKLSKLWIWPILEIVNLKFSPILSGKKVNLGSKIFAFLKRLLWLSALYSKKMSRFNYLNLEHCINGFIFYLADKSGWKCIDDNSDFYPWRIGPRQIFILPCRKCATFFQCSRGSVETGSALWVAVSVANYGNTFDTVINSQSCLELSKS